MQKIGVRAVVEGGQRGRMIKRTRYKFGSYAPQGAFFGPAAGKRPVRNGEEPFPDGLLAQSFIAAERGLGGAGGFNPRWETRRGNFGWVGGISSAPAGVGRCRFGGELVIFGPEGL